MAHRCPGIEFSAPDWPVQARYNTSHADIRFTTSEEAFSGQDPSYLTALRCLAAEQVLHGQIKDPSALVLSWRLLCTTGRDLSALSIEDLVALEARVLQEATQSSAARDLSHLVKLGRLLEQVGQRGAVGRFSWAPDRQTLGRLSELRKKREAAVKEERASILDRQVEALSDATAAMFAGDERLSKADRAALSLMNILMCAPSRVNEVLCLSVNDRFTIEHYLQKPLETADKLHSVHQHMFLGMKGSKGAAWAPKPILQCMVAVSEWCWEELLRLGASSRKLLSWYEANPKTLYLPPELEHLRGCDITRVDLAQILWLQIHPVTEVRRIYSEASNRIWKTLKASKVIKRGLGKDAGKGEREAVAWADLEPVMLQVVESRMFEMRHLTYRIRYTGTLSNMLVLVDSDTQPWLPDRLSYSKLSKRLTQRSGKDREGRSPSVFEKLGLQMVKNGVVVTAHIGTHDPRHWLTTQAYKHSERVSDVLINKWANRLKLNTLSSYINLSPQELAQQAAMPSLSEIPELQDMSQALREMERRESEYGLQTHIVTAHATGGVAVTSMQAVHDATENRPVARTGDQIIVLYPTRFGVCLNQHHETPCRSYVKCVGCNNQVAVKGHLPTNEQWRKQNDLYHRSIVNQLERLVTVRNRGVADDAEGLDRHLLTLVREGISPEQMAEELVERFHEIKDGIRDAWFREKLHDAFVAQGVVRLLDDEQVKSGAFIKYHNPSRHAAPGHERALDALGGRAAIGARIEQFNQQHPEFAPQSLPPLESGHLLLGDGRDEDEQEHSDDE